MPPPKPVDSDEDSIVLVDIPDVLRAPSEATVCRICLLTEGSMLRVSSDMEEEYHKITGIKWDKTDKLPQHLCWECAMRLRSAARLKRRAMGAYSLLRDLRTDRKFKSLSEVKLIDRHYHSLASTLSQKHFPPNEYLSQKIDYQINTKTSENVIIERGDTEHYSNIGRNFTNTKHFANIGNRINDVRNTGYTTQRSNKNGDSNGNGIRYFSKIFHVSDVNDENEVKTNRVDVSEVPDDDCLIIEAEVPSQSVASPESRSDSTMPIDELIDMYNNNGGDKRLELDQLDGDDPPTWSIDQGWGGYRSTVAENIPATPAQQATPTQINQPAKRRTDTEMNCAATLINLFSTHVNQFGTHVNQVDRQVNQVDRQVNQVDRQVNQVDTHVNQVDRQVNQVDRQVNQVVRQANQVDTQMNQVDRQVNQVDTQMNQVDRQVNQVDRQVNQVDRQVNQVNRQVNHVDTHVNHVDTHVNQVHRQVNQVARQVNQVERQVNQVDRQVNQVDRQVNQVDRQVNQVERQVNQVDTQVNWLDSQNNGTDTQMKLSDPQNGDPPMNQQDSQLQRFDSDTHTRKTKKRRTDPLPTQRLEQWLAKACEKLDRSLFTFIPVSDKEQIAEARKRQETVRFQNAKFKCHLCFRSFQASRAHVSHMLRHDESNGDHECAICRARLRSAKALKRHMFAQHTVRIKCKQCNFVTMSRSVARSHEKSHKGAIYRCQYCSSVFDNDSAFKGHLRTQHSHAHVCNICGLTFVSAQGLALHRGKRHAAADRIPLLGPYCNVCDVRFATIGACTRHLEMSSRHKTNTNTNTNKAPRSAGLWVSGL